jgi:23S rRNA pseudouridine2605 synthase
MSSRNTNPEKRHGLARMLSKHGLCSRSRAAQWIREGRVAMAGQVIRDPEHAVGRSCIDAIQLDGQPLASPRRYYLMLNKPRGLVTTATDERGRDTVYRCFKDAGLGWIAPVGRLDKASEGLLLFTNDPAWAARITDPATGPVKTYHVQVDGIPGDACLRRLEAGLECDGEWLRASSTLVLRTGTRNAWLEIVLDEGRNRQIRRLLAAVDLQVLRLVRVAVGRVALGDLAKGAWRHLDAAEAGRLAKAG